MHRWKNLNFSIVNIMNLQFDLFDDKTNKILSAKSYEEFSELLRNSRCEKCNLNKSRTNIVVDRGNFKSKVMLIGEAPGEQEDFQGKAFVGKAGQLLDKIMDSIGIDTNKDVIICNIIKCRPPENRSPSQEEANACLPFLKKQIELIKPHVIILMGATALRYIDPSIREFSMADEAGKMFKLDSYPQIDFMVLYHPAALLYNASLKKDMWEHVKVLKNYLIKKGLTNFKK